MDILHIASNNIDRDDCEQLHKTYELKNKIGRGSYGEVHQICKKNTLNCDYALKIITYDHDLYKISGGTRHTLEQVQSSWKNEVKVLQRLNQCQEQKRFVWSPILYDAWKCTVKNKVHFYMVMEKYQGNLNHFIKEHKKNPELSVYKALVIKSLETLEAYLDTIHSYCNICINDIKLDNILYKQVGPLSYQFVFADFGLSTLETTNQCMEIDSLKFKNQIEQFRNQLELGL